MKDASRDTDIIAKLDITIRLLAHLVASREPNLRAKAVALTTAGLSPAEIARVCGSTPNAVSVRLAEVRNVRSKNNRRRSRGGKS